MSPHPLIRTWRVARVATAALALAAAALTVSGSASSTGLPQSAPDAAAVSTGTPCLTKASGERVRADGTLDGVDPNDVTLAQTQQAEARTAARSRQRGLSNGRSLGKTKINVYVHVITDDDGKGGVSKSRIKKQIAVLNKAYAGKSSSKSKKTAFSFKLKATDKTKSTDWFNWSSPSVDISDDIEAKTALHRGELDDLNLYVTGLGNNLLGYSSFPFDTTLDTDGVVVLNDSLPGGSAAPYNEGDTLTHEVGHWLNLYHTFQGACDWPGDHVSDTPFQDDGDNIFFCNESDDTCPQPGTDPVHNFMSYGDDPCLDEFTPGQADRMLLSWQVLRRH